MTRAQPRYFISHSPSDQSQAIQLYKELSARGIPPRLSYPPVTDSDPVAPGLIDSRKEQALKSCSAMIVLLSKATVEDGSALTDVSYALEAYETIVLVKIKPCQLPYYLLRLRVSSRIQSYYIDLTRSAELDFTPLLNRISPLIANQSPAPSQSNTGFPQQVEPPKASSVPSIAAPPPFYTPGYVDISQQASQQAASEAVNLGVATPTDISPGEAFVARFTAYTDSEREAVITAIKREAPSAQPRMDLGGCQWKWGTRVTVRLEAKGATVAQPHQTFVWKSPSEILRFDVEVATGIPLKTLILKFDIAVEGLPIMSLRPEVAITQVPSSTKVQQPQIIQQAFPKTAFASYTQRDRKEVLGRLRSLQISTGIDVFVDCLSLRPGEKWKPTLSSEIVKRDVFLLFWSSRAMASKWVEWEWKTALQEKSIAAIQPHPLEPTDIAPPPPELCDLQFGNIYEWYLLQLKESRLSSKKREFLRHDYVRNAGKITLTSLIVLFLLAIVFVLI